MTLWQKLKVLVDIDQKKLTLRNQYNDIEKKIAEDKAVLPELEQAIQQLKRAVIDAQKNVDLQELNAQSLKDLEKEKRKALESITKEKELSAIKKELDDIFQQATEQDDALVKAWQELEEAKKNEQDNVEKTTEKIEALKQDLSTQEAALATLAQDIEVVEQEKTEKSADIPEDWLIKYNRMKNKVPNPIVPIIRNSCSSCYYSVPPQDLNRLKRDALLPCRSCYRFLYYDREEEKDSQVASF